MSAPEQLVPLTPDERQMLEARRKRPRWQAPLFGVLAIGLLALLYPFHEGYCLCALPFFGLLFAVTALIRFLEFSSLSRDLKRGHKEIVTGTVEAQDVDVSRTTDKHGFESSASYTFWIQVKGKRLTVTEEQYYKVKKGDVIEAFVAPYSGIVLGVNKEFL